MDFFQSLTLDLKILVVAIAGCALLALCTADRKAEKRYMIVFAVLASVGIYRFVQLPAEDPAHRSVTTPGASTVTVAPQRKPLVSTFAK